MKIRYLIATAVLAVALSATVQAQNPQYLTTHTTNAQITAFQGNITKTNLATLSSFTTAANRRYIQLEFSNVGTTVVYGIQLGSAGAGVFTNSQTNAVFSAGGFPLAAAGSAGSKKTLNFAIPKNGTVSGGGSITFIFQGGTVDGGAAATAPVNVEGLGY